MGLQRRNVVKNESRAVAVKSKVRIKAERKSLSPGGLKAKR